MTEADWERLRCRLANGPRCSEREADEWIAKLRAAVDAQVGVVALMQTHELADKSPGALRPDDR